MKATFVHPTHPDAQALLEELSRTLSGITGDDGKSSFATDDFDSDTDAFLVISDESGPLACGGLRYLEVGVCEIKRIYAQVKGLGSEVLAGLESKAGALGYRRVVLSTRRVNANAVRFYEKQGYREISPYGKYKRTDVSICFGKDL